MPVGIGLRSEPEPDLAVVDGVPEDFELEHPSASQTRLVVEVSDSSLRQDLGVKLRIYAGGGIPEYWVVDLKGRRIIIHTEPEGSSYGTTRYLRDDDVVAPPWGPEATIAVSELLPRIAVGEQR
jgi:Uma2 family endonuclease